LHEARSAVFAYQSPPQAKKFEAKTATFSIEN
jgi:hypothetical protein